MSDDKHSAPWRAQRWAPLAACALAYGAALLVAAAVVASLDEAHPIASALAADIAATLVVFGAGWALRNSSIYDPYWSVAPPILMLFWLTTSTASPVMTARSWLVFAIVTLWAVRLTYNCFKRWRDLEHEDFRYRDLRAQTGGWYPLVDLFGIQLFPTLLVFAASLPLFAVARSSAPLGVFDLVAAVAALSAIAIEALADHQLARFKREPANAGVVCTRGLWSWSQHPNYFGEMAFWWALYFFALAAGLGNWWMIAGPLAITGLFAFISIPMMLARKRARRPNYDAATAGISRLIPFPPRARRRNP